MDPGACPCTECISLLALKCITRVFPAVAAVALLLSGGCSTNTAPVYGMSTVGDVQLTKLDRIYRLGVGDRLKVEVFGEPELTGESDVNASGFATLPLLGDVPAKGKSMDEFIAQMRQRLSQGYLSRRAAAPRPRSVRSVPHSESRR